MEQIDSHYIDRSLLKKGDWILDAGCRNFGLKTALGKSFKYLCLDPDNTITPPIGVKFEQIALMANDGEVGYCGWSTGEGNICYKDKPLHYAQSNYIVKCKSIKTLMAEYKIKQFGHAKIDIEGSEYEFLLSVDFPFARQISVEFHNQHPDEFNKGFTFQGYMNKLMASKFGELYEIMESIENPMCKGMFDVNFKLK